MRHAVIDVGSNSVLLLVAERQGEHWRPLFEMSRVTALGQGMGPHRELQDQPVSETLAALRDFFNQAREQYGADEIQAGGTMALRLATNPEKLLHAATAQKTPITVISGEREAELGFLAVAEDPLWRQELDSNPRLTIIDVGGHSTEIRTALQTSSGWEVLYEQSFTLGALGLREQVLSEPAPDLRARLRAVTAIDEVIGMEYLPGQAGLCIALGATGTNLITMRDEMRKWQPDRVHGQWLDYEDVSKAVGRLCDLDDAGRAKLVGLERGRERTIHVGALILERCLQAIHVLGCRVSVRGWRHAALEHGL